MSLDAATVRNLELPALIELVDRTRTPIGARRLRAWLGAPMRDAESIELRLGAVAELATSADLRAALAVALKPVGARERPTSRAARGDANARELVALRRALEAIPALQKTVAACEALVIRQLAGQVSDAPGLAESLSRALVEDPPAVAREGGAIRAGFDAELDGIAEASRSAREWIGALEASERRRTGIRSLKVGFNKVFGYYIEVSNANSIAVPDDYVRKQTLTGAQRYLTPELKEKEAIVLLGQCGSFVPAQGAVVGLADRIFTRVGAHDDITSGMSTFMVEMTETANILNHATRSSLVILDEVGRGTSTYDGLSIAQAVVEHLHDSPRLGCRTLFATHYHELTALAERLKRVSNQRVEVLEDGEAVRFLHRVVPGGADRSYGIHVAALAGLPSGVIARARQVLGELERQRPLEPPELQLGLPIELAPDPLRKELEEIEPDSLSPLEALQKLYELRARLSP